jgi:hypothetical protein
MNVKELLVNGTARSCCTLALALVVVSTLAPSSSPLYSQTAGRHIPVGVVSDWTHRHVLYPDSKDKSVTARIQNQSRWQHAWYTRHPETWWPDYRPAYHPFRGSVRDWNVPLGTVDFEPMYDFTFVLNHQSGFGSLNTIDQGNGQFLASGGSLTVTGASDIGTYPLYPGGPTAIDSPSGQFIFDNILFPTYPTTNPAIDVDGLLFRNSSGFEVNIWGNGINNYEYDDTNYVNDDVGSPFTVNEDPGGGQTYPAKFVFDVTATPSCSNDFVVLGLPANAVSAGQANIVGYNNLYTGTGGFCAGAAPSVKFAYASGSGQVPANVSLSQTGKQIAYVENLTTGSSYFHVLTIGTTASEGASVTAAVVPGAGGSNAVDKRVLLSPDGGTTKQSSTTSAFVAYTPNDASDVAYVTTYNTAGSGYLYKLANVFSGSATPTIVWKAAITAIPSAPVYDVTSNKVFFTDSAGRIDYLVDTGASPTVVYSSVLAAGTTSENPVIVDSTNQVVYASFNSNGTNAIVVQATTSIGSVVTIPVGTATSTYAGPYSPDFNNAWYTGTGTPLMYVAGTGSGTVPTLYGIGFHTNGQLNSASVSSTPLAKAFADASPITEFFNAATARDYIFVGVTNNCVATTTGGAAGCVYSLDVTAGFPTPLTATSTALAATGGTTGIIVDNDGTVGQASNIYYATKTGATLVKATQSGLN